MTKIRAVLKYSYHGNLLKNLYYAFLMGGRFKRTAALIAHSVSFPVSSLYSDYLSSVLSRLLFFSLLEIDCLLPSQRHMVLIDSLVPEEGGGFARRGLGSEHIQGHWKQTVVYTTC